MRQILLFFCLAICTHQLFAQANFNERSRVAIGGGGALAYKTIGGYNARAYLQFSQKWKMMLCASDFYTYNGETKVTSKHRSFDFNVLHARKEYNDWDVFYIFEGIGAELWTRDNEPKLPFRKIVVSETATDTTSLVPCLNLGVGFEKPIGPIGFYAELELRIGSPEWVAVTFGIKTNIKRLFSGPKNKYHLNLEDGE